MRRYIAPWTGGVRNSLSRVVTINGTPWHGRREFLGGRAFFVGAFFVGALFVGAFFVGAGFVGVGFVGAGFVCVVEFDRVVEFIEVFQVVTRLGSKPHNPHNRYIHHNRSNGQKEW
ncbi:MAG: hypothetical protein L7U72_17635 [Rubripirellula sp.]|nr:hypothetical protein [Rubripirellula sp.]